MQAGATTLEKTMEASLKSKHRSAICSSNSTPGNGTQVTAETPALPHLLQCYSQ
jgi:hypothetical protein